MTRTIKDVARSDRLRELISQRCPARGRFRMLEESSGIPAWKWKNFFYKRQEAGADQIQYWTTTYPEDERGLLRAASPSGIDFERGFFAAVAKLIEMHGVSTQARDLFALAGNISVADIEDAEVFRKHGMIK